MLIKGPVQQQCAGYGLQACPELVDGVVLYVDGDKVAARHKLKLAVARNSPEQLRPFAKAVKEAVPGEAGAEIAEILSGEIEVAVASSPSASAPPASTPAGSPGHTPTPSMIASVADAYEKDEDDDEARERRRLTVSGSEPILLALAASVDPSRLLTESISPMLDGTRYGCEVLGKPSQCVSRQAGPVVVTDVVAPAGCQTDLYVGAADLSGKMRWTIPVTAAGTHGGRFFVRGDEQVTVAARGSTHTQATEGRCVVTWSGFRPRIVPMMPGTNAATLAPP